MNLKQQFENIEIMFENQIGALKYDELSEASNKCEKIADDFAIGFAEWFDDLSEDYCKDYTVKELLEIYKKEKGL